MKHLRLFTALIAVLLCRLTASAHDFEFEGIYYNIISEEELTVAVTYRGSYSYSYPDEYSGEVTIPESVMYNNNTYQVILIGQSAFYGCSSLSAITIPEGVISIGERAFGFCTGLTSITIPESMNWIVYGAFEGCSGLTSIIIPKGVKGIRGDVFVGCSNLTTITLAEDLDFTAISSDSFRDFTGELIINCNILYNTSSIKEGFLTDNQFSKVTIGDKVTLIGGGAFSGCTNLTSITIPESVTTIGEYAFSGCSSFTAIAIPESVTEIRGYTFAGCSNLTSITIPEGVTYIGDSAFEGCSGLTSITLPKGMKRIGYNAFKDCSSLASITLPESVTIIDNEAFSGCTSLTSITIPGSLTEVSYSAFEGCSNLTSITFSENFKLTALSSNVFKDFTGELIINCNIPSTSYNDIWFNDYQFSKITFGDNVTEIGDYAFCNCKRLTSITIPEGVKEIGNRAFSGCTGELFINCNVPFWENYDTPFYECEFSKVTFGDKVTSIGDYAFSNCSFLTPVVIPKSVAEIGYHAFFGCTGELVVNCNISNSAFAFTGSKFSKITIGEEVTLIGGSAFYDCTGELVVNCNISNSAFTGSKFSKVALGDKVSSIGDYAFSNCSILAPIIIPKSVTSIGVGVFNNSKSPTSIVVAEDNPVYDSRNGCNAIIETESNTLIAGCSSTIVPRSVTSIGDYAFSGCTDLTSITIPESVTSIGDYALSGCIGLTSITIPGSVTEIGNRAFSSCTGLTSITIPESVIEIGYYAFSRCTGELFINCNIPSKGSQCTFEDCEFSKVTFGDKVTSIGDNAFSGSSFLTPVVVPKSVTKIGYCAFWGCTGEIVVNCNIRSEAFVGSKFSQVTIGEGVTSIGHSAFLNCTSLTSTILPESLISIGSDAFKGCSSLASITLPENVTEIGNHAFDGCTGELFINCNIPSKSYSMCTFENCEFSKITIGDKVTLIGAGAFYNCNFLTPVIIPKSVTTIGSDAFRGCTGELVVNCNIGNNSFADSKFSQVTIGEEVTSIGRKAFENCTTLTSINISESVTSIGDFAFSGCTGLTSITIPESVTEIGSFAFSGCTGLTSITIPENVTFIGLYAFKGCTNLTDFRVKISNIGSWLSKNISYSISEDHSYSLYLDGEILTSVDIPSSVTSIGNYDFMGCSSLTSITLPEGLISIGDNAFSGCTGLTSITLPESVTEIGDWAFDGCSNLISIIVKDGNPVYDSRNDCNAIIETATNTLITGCSSTIIPDGVKSIESTAFYCCTGLTSISIPEGVTSIGGHAFSGCAALNSISIPESVTSIGEYAFYNCSNLTTINIPQKSQLTSIEQGTFCNCSSLTAINLPENVTTIGSSAFAICSNLTSITFPESLTEIGSGAFDNCKKLTSVISYIKEPLIFLNNMFYIYNSTSCTLFVPRQNYDAYNQAEVRKKFLDVVRIGNEYEVTYVENGTTIATDYVVAGKTMNTLDVEREGHSFLGWRCVTPVYETVEIDIANNADSMLYSNAPCTNTDYGDQFVGWHVLFDNKSNTFFHSEYSDIESADGEDHYLRVDLGANNELSLFSFTYATRGNDVWYTPTQIVVEGSNEADGEYTIIEILSNLPIESSKVYTSEILGNGNAYRYIRFRVTETKGNEKVFGHPYFYISEFSMTGYIAYDYGYPVTEMIMPAKDIVMEGSFLIRDYQIAYIVDGDTVKTDSVTYGAVIPLLEEPTKEGHTFMGWGEIPETMPAKDMAFVGDFSVNKYLVTFMVDDVVLVSDSLEYGSSIVLPNMPKLEGHTFSGWGEVATSVPAHDVIYHASYSPNVYTVYYFVGSTLVHTAKVTYGAAIPEYIYKPTTEGDEFIGWVGETYETMPAHDVTYVANIVNGIGEIENSKLKIENSIIYDLSGRKLQVGDLRELSKGVYIVNGRKVTIKD